MAKQPTSSLLAWLHGLDAYANTTHGKPGPPPARPLPFEPKKAV